MKQIYFVKTQIKTDFIFQKINLMTLTSSRRIRIFCLLSAIIFTILSFRRRRNHTRDSAKIDDFDCVPKLNSNPYSLSFRGTRNLRKKVKSKLKAFMEMIVLAPIAVEILLCRGSAQKITSSVRFARVKRIAGLAPENFKKQAKKNPFQMKRVFYNQ